MAQVPAHATENALGEHGGHGHAHPPHLAHHFDTPQQQFESSKLGMWAFLATEILMFGGLFCAYSVYRANHPEVFLYAHHFLDTFWGAFNTVVLLVSSFTMAWAVRAAQLGQRGLLTALLTLTFLGGAGFMFVKSVEYTAKFSHDLAPGGANAFYPVGTGDTGRWTEIDHIEHYYQLGGAHGAVAGEGVHGDSGHGEGEDASHGHPNQDPLTLEEGHSVAESVHEMAAATASGGPAAAALAEQVHEAPPGTVAAAAAKAAPPVPNIPADHSLIAPAASGPAGLTDGAVVAGEIPDGAVRHGVYSFAELDPVNKERVHLFFQIYFLMTGLHGLHVLIGMGLIAWVLHRGAGAANRAWTLPMPVVVLGVFLGFVWWYLGHEGIELPSLRGVAGSAILGVAAAVALLAGVAWLAYRVVKKPVPADVQGDFGPEYFTPVDLVGLYWHLVDLIWIFLFPLLYLIH